MISAGYVGDVMHLDDVTRVSRAFHEDTDGRGGDALAKAGDDAARDDDQDDPTPPPHVIISKERDLNELIGSPNDEHERMKDVGAIAIPVISPVSQDHPGTNLTPRNEPANKASSKDYATRVRYGTRASAESWNTFTKAPGRPNLSPATRAARFPARRGAGARIPPHTRLLRDEDERLPELS